MTAPGGGQPDVSVRFHPDGEDAVTRAVKEVANQLQLLSGKQQQAARATGGFTDALGLAKRALGTFGVALSLNQLFSFARQAVEATARTADLAEQAGLSAEEFTTLAFHAGQAGAAGEDVATAFAALSKSMADAKGGNEQAAAAFLRLGITLEDLQRLTRREIFERVATALQTIPPSAERTDLALTVLGRGATVLTGLLAKLGTDGFGVLREEAEKANAVLDEKTVKAVQEFEDGLGRIKQAGQGALIKALFGEADPATVAREMDAAAVSFGRIVQHAQAIIAGSGHPRARQGREAAGVGATRGEPRGEHFGRGKVMAPAHAQGGDSAGEA